MTATPQRHGSSKLVRVLSPLGELRMLLVGVRLARIFLPGLPGQPLPLADADLDSRCSSPADLVRACAAWFRGREEPLAAYPRRLSGSPCRESVWRVVRAIPRGELRTYREVALAAGLGPHGARAVGGALRANPLPLVVPCHRVVGVGGRLLGFGGAGPVGLALKRRLLEMEGIQCANGI